MSDLWAMLGEDALHVPDMGILRKDVLHDSEIDVLREDALYDPNMDILREATLHVSEMDMMVSPKNCVAVPTQYQGRMNETGDQPFIYFPEGTQSLEEQVTIQVCGLEGQNSDHDQIRHSAVSGVWQKPATNNGVQPASNIGISIDDAIQQGDATPGITVSAGIPVGSDQCAPSVEFGCGTIVGPSRPIIFSFAPGGASTAPVRGIGTRPVGNTFAVTSGGVHPEPSTAMPVTPSRTPAAVNAGRRKTKPNKKPKLHQIKTPFADPVMEKKRLQAIKAWKNREKKKLDIKKLRSQVEEDRKEKLRLNEKIRQLQAAGQEKNSVISQYQSIPRNS